jgi:hypothetical protein
MCTLLNNNGKCDHNGLNVMTTTRLRAGGAGVRMPAWAKYFIFQTTRPAPRPIQPSIQWVPGAPSRIYGDREGTDQSNPPTAQVKSQWSHIPPFPSTPSWGLQGQPYLYLYLSPYLCLSVIWYVDLYLFFFKGSPVILSCPKFRASLVIKTWRILTLGMEATTSWYRKKLQV